SLVTAAVKHECGRTAILSLITRVGYQHQSNMIVAKQPEHILAIHETASPIARQSPGFASEITNAQVHYVCRPPCRVIERSKLRDQRLDRRDSLRELENLLVVIVELFVTLITEFRRRLQSSEHGSLANQWWIRSLRKCITRNREHNQREYQGTVHSRDS